MMINKFDVLKKENNYFQCIKSDRKIFTIAPLKWDDYDGGLKIDTTKVETYSNEDEVEKLGFKIVEFARH